MNQKLKIYKLKNGVEVYYKPIPKAKEAVIYLGLQGGVIDEGKNGLAHLLEHMLIVEAKFYKKQIEKSFGKFSWDYEANTYKGYTEFGFSTSKKNFIPTLMAILQALQKPRFPKKDIIREKKFILKEWRRQKNLDYGLADHNLDQTIFRSPFSNPTVGNYAIIKSLNKSDLLKYWEKNINGSRIKVAISGDISEFSIEKLKQLLSTIPSGGYPILKIDNWYKKSQKMVILGRIPAREIFVKVCIPVVKINLYKSYPAALISSIFAGSKDSFLDRAYRHLKINQSIGAGIFEYRNTIYLDVSFRAPKKKILDAFSMLTQIWRRFRKGNLPVDVLNREKRNFIKENKEKINCPVCTAKDIIQETMYVAPHRRTLLPNDKIKKFSHVSQNDILKTIKSFSEPGDWTASIVGSKKNATNQLVAEMEKILKNERPMPDK